MSRKNLGAQPALYPQPVLIVATYDGDGRPNAMNAAWGGICGRDEVMIDMSSHKTSENIAVTKAFTYEEHSQRLTKEAWVYVPYGYDENKQYDIMYLSHGGRASKNGAEMFSKESTACCAFCRRYWQLWC